MSLKTDQIKKDTLTILINSINELKLILKPYDTDSKIDLLIKKKWSSFLLLDNVLKSESEPVLGAEAEPVDFKKVFEKERNVKFSSEKIMKLKNFREKLNALVLINNKLQPFKKGYYSNMKECSYEKCEEHFGHLIESLFDYVYDDSGKIQKTPLIQTVNYLQPIINQTNGRIGIKKGVYSWQDKFIINPPSGTDSAAFLDELTEQIIQINASNIEQSIKKYEQLWNSAMGQNENDKELKKVIRLQLFNGSEKLMSNLVLCEDLLLRKNVVPYEVKKQRLFDLSVFARNLTDKELHGIYKCFKEYFWPKSGEPINTFESFKKQMTIKRNENVPFVIEEEKEFAAFFMVCQTDYDCLHVLSFNTRSDLHDVKNFCRLFKKMTMKMDEIFLKTEVEYCTCYAPDKLILKLTEQVGFEKFTELSDEVYKMKLDVKKYLKRKGLK